MQAEVLLSVMREDGNEVISRSHLEKCRALVVNQCDAAADELVTLDDRHRVLNTGSRGLSVSRNLAISNAVGDICICADNDEIFAEDLSAVVCEAYRQLPSADVIAFKVKIGEKVLKLKGNLPRKIKKYEALKVHSVMITFKRSSVAGKVAFDPLLGAGTGNGGGEENKFILDCFKKGLQIYYVPVLIAEIKESGPSTWFTAFDAAYYYKWACVMRYVLGLPTAALYAVYTLLKKYPLYKTESTPLQVAVSMAKGLTKGKNGLAAPGQKTA